MMRLDLTVYGIIDEWYVTKKGQSRTSSLTALLDMRLQIFSGQRRFLSYCPALFSRVMRPDCFAGGTQNHLRVI